VIVALEKQENGVGTIVNETTPDKKGNFNFEHVAAGNYAVVVAAVSNKQVAYTPVVLVSADAAFGAGKKISPGTNVGTIPVLLGAGTGWTQISVPVNSDAPVTTTITAAINVAGHGFEFPWSQGIPTFDTAKQIKCSNQAACTTNNIQVPSAPALFAVFNGPSTNFQSNGTRSIFDISAKAYTQNGAKPTCEPNATPVVRAEVSEGKPSQIEAFNFSSCQ
jgi:hypothetical protein